MALIVKCRACKRRLEPGLTGSCPFCAAMARTYVVDYMEDGRHSRRRVELPEAVRDETAARAIEGAMRDALKRRKADAPTPVPASATVDDLMEEYLEYYGMHRAKSTAREVGYVFRGAVSRILGRIRVAEYDSRHVTLYKKLRLAEEVSNRTVNLELDYVSGFLKWCRRAKGVDVSPPAVEKLPYKRPIPIILSPGEVVRLLDAADPFHRAIFLCLYTLGLRFSEARWLRWTDLDLENQSVRVRQKGGSHKTLPLNGRLCAAIEAMQTEREARKARRQKRTGEEPAPCPWVFESRAGSISPACSARTPCTGDGSGASG